MEAGTYVPASFSGRGYSSPSQALAFFSHRFSLPLTFFFNIFFINGPFFYSHARKLAYQGEMKCLSNVILTRVYMHVRKCYTRC